MEIIGYILLAITALLVFATGFFCGVEHSLNNIHAIGTLKIAHDENDEKYLAIVIDPAHKNVLDDRKNGVHIFYVEHVFNEESK